MHKARHMQINSGQTLWISPLHHNQDCDEHTGTHTHAQNHPITHTQNHAHNKSLITPRSRSRPGKDYNKGPMTMNDSMQFPENPITFSSFDHVCEESQCWVWLAHAHTHTPAHTHTLSHIHTRPRTPDTLITPKSYSRLAKNAPMSIRSYPPPIGMNTIGAIIKISRLASGC